MEMGLLEATPLTLRAFAFDLVAFVVPVCAATQGQYVPMLCVIEAPLQVKQSQKASMGTGLTQTWNWQQCSPLVSFVLSPRAM